MDHHRHLFSIQTCLGIMAHSEHPEQHPDNKVLSVFITPTGSPTLIDGPSSPTRSIHTEIGSVSQVQHSGLGSQNTDLLDSADDAERRQSIISNYPEGSTIRIKSPHETIFGSTTINTPVDSQLGTPTRSPVLSDNSEKASTRALAPKSPRRPSIDSEHRHDQPSRDSFSGSQWAGISHVCYLS